MGVPLDTHKYDNARIGLNARLDTLQAAVLNAKFDIFPQEIELRNQVASKYTELLAPCSTLHAPCVPEGYKSAWAQYSVISNKREQIQSALKEKGIPTAVYYPKPLHLQTAFAYLGYNEGICRQVRIAQNGYSACLCTPARHCEPLRRGRRGRKAKSVNPRFFPPQVDYSSSLSSGKL